MDKKLDTLPDCVSSSFQAVPTHDPPPHAYLCHFQSAFCHTLPTPPMPGVSGWGNSFFGSTPSRHMRPPGVKPGAQAWEACMLPLHYRMTQAKKQGSGCWRLPRCPAFFLSAQGLHIPPHGHLSQHLRAHCQSSPSCAASKHMSMTKCICISRETNPGHIDGDDVFCH